jgi:hypothetical protein
MESGARTAAATRAEMAKSRFSRVSSGVRAVTPAQASTSRPSPGESAALALATSSAQSWMTRLCTAGPIWSHSPVVPAAKTTSAP